MSMINFQPEFRPALPCVFGSKDYREFRAALIEADRILRVSGVEDRLIATRLAAVGSDVSSRHLQRHIKTLHLALRHSILLSITGLSFRALVQRMADSHLFQWFTHTGFVDAVRPVSKSTIERFEKMFDADEVAGLIHDLNRSITHEQGAYDLLYRETALRFDTIFADTTCVKSNIHCPVDWILLRDATRTLMKAITLIRKQGLKHRMGSPDKFMREMTSCALK